MKDNKKIENGNKYVGSISDPQALTANSNMKTPSDMWIERMQLLPTVGKVNTCFLSIIQRKRDLIHSDVYDAFHESEKRQKIIMDELKLAGEFIPSKTTHSLDVVSKAKLPEILNEIEFYFKKLFKDKVGYFIGVNKRDYIEIMFEDKYRDDNKVQMTLSGMLEH